MLPGSVRILKLSVVKPRYICSQTVQLLASGLLSTGTTLGFISCISRTAPLSEQFLLFLSEPLYCHWLVALKEWTNLASQLCPMQKDFYHPMRVQILCWLLGIKLDGSIFSHLFDSFELSVSQPEPLRLNR